MIVVDVNVLVAAAIASHPYHAVARRFLEDALTAGEVAVPDVVWSGFVRTVTNAAVADPPPTWDAVRTFVGAVRGHPGYRADVRGLVSSIDSLVALCQRLDLRRNLVSDAHVAMVAADHNAAVATFDTDFDKMPVAVIHPPLSGAGTDSRPAPPTR